MYNCIYYVHMYMFLSLLYNHDMCRLMFSYAPSPPPPHTGCLGGTRASHNYQSCISLINHARLHSRLGLSAS